MEYTTEIRQVISEYDKIHAGLNELEEMTKLLELRKNELDQALSSNREREKTLIDKIVRETGKAPDYYKIMNELNETA
jgi:CHASE3 domain sensor protein